MFNLTRVLVTQIKVTPDDIHIHTFVYTFWIPLTLIPVR